MPDLPLLCYTSSLLPGKIDRNTVLVGVQHLAFTTLELIKELIRKGMSPSNIFLLGKCYSANPLVVEQLRSMGVYVSSLSFAFESHFPYDETFKKNTEKFLKELLLRVPNIAERKVIVLDDGAALLRMSKKFFPESCEIVGIEQTSSGYHLASKISSELPIINVARSNLKLTLETKFISRMVARKVFEYVQSTDSNIRQVLVMGSGYIGKAVAARLKKKYRVKIYDQRKSLKNVDHESLSNLLKEADLIVGCTGFSSLSPNDYKYLKNNAILISASSSDREFSASDMRKKIPPYSSCHVSPQISDILLVNSGFPINFDGNYLDSTELQLTRSLILTAIFQAEKLFGKGKKGFITLGNQNEIRKKYLELNNSRCFLSSGLKSQFEFDNRDVTQRKVS